MAVRTFPNTEVRTLQGSSEDCRVLPQLQRGRREKWEKSPQVTFYFQEAVKSVTALAAEQKGCFVRNPVILCLLLQDEEF